MCYNFVDGVGISKHKTIYTSDHRNVIKISKFVNSNGNGYYIKITSNTTNMTNNITRHNHNSYERNVIKKVKTCKTYQ